MAKITIDDTLISRPIPGIKQWDQIITYLNAINDNTSAVYTSSDNVFSGDNTFSGESDLTGDFKINSVTVGATASEINKAADLSAQIQTITTSGAQVITAGVQAVYLNENTTAIASTIATSVAHQGMFLIKAGLEPAGGQDHTCVISTGSWDGTNQTATFADLDDFLLVYFDAAGAGTILVNNGSVALS